MTICRTQVMYWTQHRYFMLMKRLVISYKFLKEARFFLMGGFFIVSCLLNPAQAQLIDNRVTPLTAIDKQYMQSQRQLAADLTLRYYGTRCCRTREDLAVLQRMLDDRTLSSAQAAELQALGLVMGDLLAAELGMEWVVYEDIQGRSRALQLANTDNFLFPITMISRRYGANAPVDVMGIYSGAVDTINAAKPPLPFQ